MSTSTNGIVFYGICLPDGFCYKNEDFIIEESKDLGIEMDYHCTYDYKMWFLCISERKVRCYRGYPEKISTSATKEEIENWNERLFKFCEKYKISYTEPDWWLVSFWGI